jgi:hypothetical protein
MTDKEEQLRHFREALDRKERAAEQSAQAHAEQDGPPPAETGHPQAGHSPTETGVGKDKMTADKWNQ